MAVCKEMKKLRQRLDRLKICWADYSDTDDYPPEFDICRTTFFLNGNMWSVVNGMGTYGGMRPGGKRNLGLLELMTKHVNGGEPIGWLTAADVMKYVKKELKGELKK